jgi:hypothetical protein
MCRLGDAARVVDEQLRAFIGNLTKAFGEVELLGVRKIAGTAA